ncbi:MAG: MFS transporter [Acetobacteraceae bacterium]|nr:MFS transporter [Acetobacteraceae bacterium]
MPDETPTRVTGRRKKMTALIVAAAMFMEMVDGTVIATALPDMARSFGADPLHMSVALTSYLLSLAVFIPVSGIAADRFGARTVFGFAIFLFTLGSALCGLAHSLSFLIGARILQGVGGAMMSPVGRLVLLRTVSKSELVSTMAWLMVPATLGPLVGPPIGGFITTYLSWRWIFFLNLPIGVIGLAMTAIFIDDMHYKTAGPFDRAGFVLSGLSLACLIFGLETASRGIGSVFELGGLLVVGLVSGILYFRHARHHPNPLLDFSLMRIPTFKWSVIAGACSRNGAGAMPFLLPMMLQIGFGISAAQSGTVTFAGAAGSMIMRLIARPALHRWGFRNTLIWAGLAATLLVGCIAMFRPSWPWIAIYLVLLVQGCLQSLQFMAYNTICYADIPRQRMSAATSFYTTFQQVFLSVGIATSAAALSASTALLGHKDPTLADFSVAFFAVTAVALFAPAVSALLDPNAGAELSGRPSPAEVSRPEPAAAVAPPPPRPTMRRPTTALLDRSTRAARQRGRA